MDVVGLLFDAPVGTRAPSITGGEWVRTDHGWQWNGNSKCPGSTFPRPGGDWNGTLIYPDDKEEGQK